MSNRKPAWSWRHAILESDLHPTTRHVLLTISCFMNDLGDGCYREVADIVSATGLNRATVYRHINFACGLNEKGDPDPERPVWLARERVGLKGPRWARVQMLPRWPERGLTATGGGVALTEDELERGVAENDPSLEEAEEGSQRTTEGSRCATSESQRTTRESQRTTPIESSPSSPLSPSSQREGGDDFHDVDWEHLIPRQLIGSQVATHVVQPLLEACLQRKGDVATNWFPFITQQAKAVIGEVARQGWTWRQAEAGARRVAADRVVWPQTKRLLDGMRAAIDAERAAFVEIRRGTAQWAQAIASAEAAGNNFMVRRLTAPKRDLSLRADDDYDRAQVPAAWLEPAQASEVAA